MKITFYFCLVLVAFFVTPMEGASNHARVFKLNITSSNVMLLYESNVVKGWGNVVQRMTNNTLALGDRDVVIVYCGSGTLGSNDKAFLSVIVKACERARTQLGVCREKEDLRNTTVAHWHAPYDDPRDFDATQYFIEGRYLGEGLHGYELMMKELVEGRNRHVLIVGSRYHDGDSWAPEEVPFWEYRSEMERMFSESNIKKVFIYYHQFAIWPDRFE